MVFYLTGCQFILSLLIFRHVVCGPPSTFAPGFATVESRIALYFSSFYKPLQLLPDFHFVPHGTLKKRKRKIL